ncbi:Glucooligosaccharide oxidase [Rhypophila sp. PSN 637]
MRTSVFTSFLATGFLTLTQAGPIVTRAEIETCLVGAGVPIDAKNSADWRRDVAPFNTRLPYTPVAIAVPRNIEQIRNAVLCGKKLGIKVSAKSGGHSYASFGFGGEDGHLIVQLDRMNEVTYDADTDVATVQAGTRLGHLASVLYRNYGRAVSHGTCPGVGISGHFAHGGFGFSSHTHGLAQDFVVGATVVLADGSIVEASETQNPDLFWAIRGAGSNFGIIAKWRLRTFEAPNTLTFFSVDLKWTRTTAVAGLEAVERYARDDMPREINFRVSDYARGQIGIEGLYYGTDAQMREAIAPLLSEAAPQANITRSETVTWIEAVTHYGLIPDVDVSEPSPQENFYAKSLTLNSLSGDTARAFVDYHFTNSSKLPFTRAVWFQLDMHGGYHSAISSKSNSSTAYPHRDKLYIIQFYDRQLFGSFPRDGMNFLDGWVDAVVKTLPGGSAGVKGAVAQKGNEEAKEWGMYVNYADASLDRDTAEKLYYGGNLARLRKLKARYDPTDLFYYPQGIRPVA